MLTNEEQEWVRKTWAMVSGDPDAAAALFYGRLFAVAPEVKALFPSELDEQGRKLVQMIDLAVKGLAHPDRLVPTLRVLGRRHVGYGALPAHYAVVGRCLLWTLATALGEQFSDAAEASWAKTYALLADGMQSA